jgi:hypothetical protein
MSAYDEGYSIGRIHADGSFNIDPRHSMAEHARQGTLDEFMRGFDAGYAGRAKESSDNMTVTEFLDLVGPSLGWED